MKNKIQIDVDTDRKPNVLIGHPLEFNPSTPEEAKVVILNDISCVFEAFCQLIHIADQNNYGKKSEFVKTAIDQLNNMVIEKPKETEI